MIDRIEIQNFRGLQNVSLDGLRSINLIVGGNDTGKTSVLEALVLLLGDANAIHNLSTTFRTNRSGAQSHEDQDDRENFWSWLFYDQNFRNKITIAGTAGTQAKVSVRAEQRLDNQFQSAQEDVVLVRRTSPDGSPPKEMEIVRFGAHQPGVTKNGGVSPLACRVAILSTRPSNPTSDAENYNLVALLADGERRIVR